MDNHKRIAVLGCTGSIGRQTLDIISRCDGRYKATVLSAGKNADELIAAARQHRPAMVVIADADKYAKVKAELEPLGIECACSADALEHSVERDDVDMVVTATVGYSGLAPTLAAIRAGKDIALANKETMVVAGSLVNSLLEHSATRIYPVDSEHSAIYQCLQGEDPAQVKRLVITASGGPFRTWSREQIEKATVSDALKHPNWSMGAKITIDSASMLNKAFEIIEARWLFGITPDRIDAVVHPQSIIHSMVEFVDGALKAQLGTPDMRLPIAYALGETQRTDYSLPALRLEQMAQLTFFEPDTDKFPCLKLAYHALEQGGTTACVINAANEVAVAAFLQEQIKFTGIYDTIIETLARVPKTNNPDYNDYVATNANARQVASSIISSIK